MTRRGAGLGGRFDYSWTVGEFRRIGGVSAFDPRSHLLSPVERRHSQRVRVRTRDLSWGPAPAVGRSASGGDGDYNCDLSDTPEGGKLTESSDGWDALNDELSEAASENDYRKVCKKLQAGADPDYPGFQRSGYEDRALHFAAALEDDAVEIVTLLVSAGADVDALGADKETALHHAANWSAYRVAAYLLERGAYVNSKSYNGEVKKTPLDFAVQDEDRRMAELLRGYGGECVLLSGDNEWCDGVGLSAPLGWIGGVTLYAASGYQGSLPAVSAAETAGRGVSVGYGLSGASEDFVFDGTLRVLSTSPAGLSEPGRLYSVTLWAAGLQDSLQTLTLYATAVVSLLSDVSRTVTASPYADYSSGGGLVTLSSLWEGLPGALSYEKAGGSEELTLTADGFARWDDSARATVFEGYEMEVLARAPWLAGALSFSLTVSAACAAEAEHGRNPDSSRDILIAAHDHDLKAVCWHIGRDSEAVNRGGHLYGRNASS